MCVIIMLPAGSMIPAEKLFNAVHNNPHGYGLLCKKDDNVEAIQGLWMEPEDIHKLLLEKVDTDRFLHVRYNTAGSTTTDNVHPFKVLDTKDRKIWFMHNGTLHRYRPAAITTTKDGVTTTVAHPDSDSKRFADTLLTPLLSRWYGPNGVGDLEDPFLAQIINNNWDQNSKGVLIATDLNPLYLEEKKWTTHEYTVQENGKQVKREWFSSNDQYFDTLTRGPLYERRKAEAEAARRAEQESVRRFQEAATGNKRGVTDIKTLDLTKSTSKELVAAFGTLFESVTVWEHENLAKLSYMTSQEMEEIQKEYPLEFSAIVGYMFQEFGTLYQKIEDMEDEIDLAQQQAEKATEKHEEATRMIATLKNKIKRLESQEVHVG